MTLRIGSLFAGCGGLEKGLEDAGVGEVVWQVEIDPFCRSVLAKHWPKAVRYEDVREVGAANLPPVDVLCGGFPCQPFSLAGKRKKQADERHLWPEYARIIRELQPKIVVGENVAALLAGGADEVLGDLATLGYDALWDCVPAQAVRAPHRRDRLFIVAWRRDVAESDGGGRVARVGVDDARQPDAVGRGAPLADTDRLRERQPEGREPDEQRRIGDGGEGVADAARGARFGTASGRAGYAAQRSEVMADANDSRPQGHGRPVDFEHSPRRQGADGYVAALGPSAATGLGAPLCGLGRNSDVVPSRLDGCFRRALARVNAVEREWPARPGEEQRPFEPPRTARGVKQRSHRLKALGNAVLPVVGEVIGHVVNEILGVA